MDICATKKDVRIVNISLRQMNVTHSFISKLLELLLMLSILLLSTKFVYLFGFLISDTADHEYNHCFGYILTVFIIVAVRRVNWILHVVEFVLGYLFQNASCKPRFVLLKHVLDILTKDRVKEILGLVDHRAILKQASSSFGFACKIHKCINLFNR